MAIQDIIQQLLKQKPVSPLPDDKNYISPVGQGVPDKKYSFTVPQQAQQLQQQPQQQGQILGIASQQPPAEYAQLIQKAAEENNIHPALLAALLYQESRYDPQAVNEGSGDYGMAQISLKSHPDVTKEQALDPNFAIPWAAQFLAQNNKRFPDNPSRALAAYNVGGGGASVQGKEPFGGGPLGQSYVNNVSRNLALELVKELGLVTSER